MTARLSRRAFVALGASLAAFPGVARAVLRTPAGGALRWPLAAPWRVFDPGRAVDLADTMMAGLVHDTLATLHPDGAVTYPLLAGPPVVAGDGLSATLSLRPGMRFGNGAAVTAQTVAAAWLTARDGALGRLVLALGRSINPVEVRGALELTVHLALPNALDAWLLAPPMAPTVAVPNGPRAGLGAFVLSGSGEGRTLPRNPHCPRGLAHLERVQLVAPQGRNDEVRAFTTEALEASWWGRSLYGVERVAGRVEPAATGAVVGLVLPARGVLTSAPIARALERILAPLSAPGEPSGPLRRLPMNPGPGEVAPIAALVQAVAARGAPAVVRIALDARDALLNDVGERIVALLDAQGLQAALVPRDQAHDAALRAVASVGVDPAMALASFVAVSGDEAGASAIVRSARARRAEVGAAVWSRTATAMLGIIAPGIWVAEGLRGARVDAMGRLDLADAWMARGRTP